MEDFGIRVERAALLHDIGKLVLRAQPARMNHSQAGVAFLQRYAESEDADILRAVGHHHAAALRSLSQAAPSDLSYLVYEADNLAAGSDRRALEASEQEGFSARKPLDSIFSVFGREAAAGAGEAQAPGVGAYHLQGLLAKDRPQYPQPAARVQATTAEYAELLAYLEANFQRRSPFRMEIHELTRVLEGVLSYVPSSTSLGEAADISLYDHVRLTAAYAVLLYRYLAARGVTDYRGTLFSQAAVQALRQEETGLLVSGDLSGIQSFIYTIPSAGALKSLRGRSFYLEILMENIADEILARAGMSRSSLLYTGGGHFYLLLPHTPEARAALEEARESINDWMLAQFGSRLYLALAWTPFAAQEFLPGAEPGTRGGSRGRAGCSAAWGSSWRRRSCTDTRRRSSRRCLRRRVRSTGRWQRGVSAASAIRRRWSWCRTVTRERRPVRSARGCSALASGFSRRMCSVWRRRRWEL